MTTKRPKDATTAEPDAVESVDDDESGELAAEPSSKSSNGGRTPSPAPRSSPAPPSPAPPSPAGDDEPADPAVEQDTRESSAAEAGVGEPGDGEPGPDADDDEVGEHDKQPFSDVARASLDDLYRETSASEQPGRGGAGLTGWRSTESAPPAALPPWQRAYSAGAAAEGATAAANADLANADVETDLNIGIEPEASPLPGLGSAPAAGAPAEPTAPVPPVPPVTDGSGAPGSWSASRPLTRTRPPRQASLQLKRIDPWSVLKLALVLAAVGFFVWLVAVGVLYGVLDGMGVWDRLNGTYSDLVSPDQTGGGALISAGRVFGLAAIVGAINSLLFAVAITVGAFVYNVSAELVGGIELTLSERD